MSKLVTLNLSNNKIVHIQGLDQLTELSILDLSGNQIKEVNGLQNQNKLTLLNLSNNLIDSPQAIEPIKFNTSLNCLHLSRNPLPPNIEILTFLSSIPLLTLYLKDT